jgi:putative ABC transport system permease protein
MRELFMLLYTLRLALRHFSKKRIYSTIIVLSLTAGFTCTCLLVSFLVSESSVDSFHKDVDRTFQLSSNDPFGGSGKITYNTRHVRDYLADTYGEIENICLVSALSNPEIEPTPSNFVSLKTISVDTSFFTVFNFPLESGTTASLTSNEIMLTRASALKFFGRVDLLGKPITIRTTDTTRTLTVSGIIGQAPEKSHLRFEALVHNSVFKPRNPRNVEGGATYVILNDKSQAAALTEKINGDTLRPSLIGPGGVDYSLEPMSKAYFNSSNKFAFTETRSETFIWVGWIVCGLILFMATFNFINLVLLAMQERRKETGIKKTLGISFTQMVRSSLVESSIYIVASFLLSVGAVYSLLPLFNTTLETELLTSYFFRFRVIGIIVSVVTVITMIVVVLSALFQRKILPVSMLKSESTKVRFSKFFFTLQFFMSITLVVCSVTIIRQMHFLETEPLGFNRNILQFRLPSQEDHSKIVDLKNRVLQIPGINKAALSQGNPISGNMIARYDLEDGGLFTPNLFAGDGDLIETLHLEVLQGKAGLTQPTDKLVNETLVKHFNMSDPIGQIIPGTQDRISGVVKDFTCSSFKQEIPPVIISFDPKSKLLLVDYSGSDLTGTLTRIKTEWAEVFPNNYFDHKIIQNDLMKKYSEETQFYKVVVAASLASMVISCFGLFALSWAVIKSRAREMGIRKVLGAGTTDILRLLTASFTKRLLLAFALAAPAGYYLVNLWLARFVYKLPIDGWIFVITGVSLATIALVTLGLQTIRASLSSPLNEIRE